MSDRWKLYIFNLYFYTLFLLCSALVISVLTIGVTLLGIFFLPPRKTWRRFRRAISWYGKAAMAVPYPFIKIAYERFGNNAADGPYIFVCNHRSAVDPFLIGVLPQELVQTVNIWPFRIPVLGVYAKFSGYLNIRMMPREEFMQRAQQLLREGVSVVFFPEGTRSVTGKMGSFHSAAFRLALESGASVVPICMTGTEQVLPKGSSLIRPGTITVRELAAISQDEYKDLTAFAFKNRVWNILDRELSKMENTA
jgi:1-acyl-sn-glycerol-3-phosphate acyltransferase